MAWGSVPLALVGALVLFFLYKIIAYLKSARHPPLPPGPKPQFLVGNLGDLPKPGEQEWTHWLKHKDLYGLYMHSLGRGDWSLIKLLTAGGISSVTVMGQTLIILHDVRLAFELMEKRSAKHSSRPKQTFAGEMYADKFGVIKCVFDHYWLLLGAGGKIPSVFRHTTVASDCFAKTWLKFLGHKSLRHDSTLYRRLKLVIFWCVFWTTPPTLLSISESTSSYLIPTRKFDHIY